MTLFTVLPLSSARGEPTYLYENPSDPDSKIELRGFFIEQHGKKIHSYFARCRDIDRLCHTPAIGDKSNKDMAELFTSSDITWQRQLNTKRIHEIKKWWEKNTSLSTNGSIIWLNEEYTPQIDEERKDSLIKIDPSTWTKTECPSCSWKPGDYDVEYAGWYFDCCLKCGECYRPGKLVDGQHRVRGMSQAGSSHCNEPVLTTALFERDGFDSERTARIFTEVTSKAQGLEALHAEFLMAKYNIVPKYSTSSTSGRNRKTAYETTVKLNKSPTKWSRVSPTTSKYKGRIKMISPTKSKIDLIESIKMTDYIASWIEKEITTKGGEIAPLGGDSTIAITEYLENFLDAMLELWGPSSGGKNDFWDDSRGELKAVQRKGVFRMMMHLFGIITARIKLSGRTPVKAHYLRELKHVKNIAWTDKDTWAGTYTKQDTEQAIVRNVLSHIYLYAPNPLTSASAPISAVINSWMDNKIEKFTVSIPDKSLSSGKFSIISSSQTKIHDPAFATSVNLKRGPLNATATCEIKISCSGDVIHENPSAKHGYEIEYNQLKTPSGLPVGVGQKLDIEVTYKNAWANSRTEKTAFTVIA
jgi:hypothetical protein